MVTMGISIRHNIIVCLYKYEKRLSRYITWNLEQEKRIFPSVINKVLISYLIKVSIKDFDTKTLVLHTNKLTS